MQHEASIKGAELELLRASTRRDSPRVRALLHESFIEIGRTGRRWTREEIISSLAAEDDHPMPEVTEWSFAQLSDELVLVTYLIRTTTGESRHASVWDTASGPPRMRFHQGTPLPRDGSSK